MKFALKKSFEKRAAEIGKRLAFKHGGNGWHVICGDRRVTVPFGSRNIRNLSGIYKTLGL